MFERIGKLSSGSIGKTGENARRIAAALVLDYAAKAIAETLGPEAAAGLVPQSFRSGRLLVRSAHGVWSQELRLREREVADALNRRLGQEAVKKIAVT